MTDDSPYKGSEEIQGRAVINVTPHIHRLIGVTIGVPGMLCNWQGVLLASGSSFHLYRGYQKCLKVQFRWLGGGYSGYWDDGRSRQAGGASDDWKPVLDGIGGTIGSGMVVRGGQGGTKVTKEGMTGVPEGGAVGISCWSWTPQAFETHTLGGLWHTAGA